MMTPFPFPSSVRLPAISPLTFVYLNILSRFYLVLHSPYRGSLQYDVPVASPQLLSSKPACFATTCIE